MRVPLYFDGFYDTDLLDIDESTIANSGDVVVKTDGSSTQKGTTESGESCTKFIDANGVCVSVIIHVASRHPSCDDLQFRLALAHLGLIDAVKAHVAASDAFVQAWWERTKTFKADNPMLIEQAAAMGLGSQFGSVIELAATMPSNA